MIKLLIKFIIFIFLLIGLLSSVNAASIEELLNLRHNDDSFSFRVNGSFEGVADGTYQDMVYERITLDEAIYLYNTITDSYVENFRQVKDDAYYAHQQLMTNPDTTAGLTPQERVALYDEKVKAYIRYQNIQLIKKAAYDKIAYDGSNQQKCNVGLTHFCNLEDTNTGVNECGDGYVLENGQCILEFKPSTDCLDGYVLKDGVCEKSGINIFTKIIGGKNPPLEPNGNDFVEYQIKGTYSDGSLVDLSFDVGYTTGPKKGTVSVSGDKNGYRVKYTSPNIESFKADSIEEYLYIFYYPKGSNEKKYEKHKILLFGNDTQLLVRKPGYVEKIVPINFSSDKTLVKVYGKGPKNDKLPLIGVELTHSQYFTRYTDKDGKALVESSENKRGKEQLEMEVILELDSDVAENMRDSFELYNEMLLDEYITENDTVRDFITNFEKHLASSDNETESKKIVSAIKRIKTSLAIMSNGNSIADDASIQVGGAWNNIFWDIYDLAGTIDILNAGIQKIFGKAKDLVGNSEKYNKLMGKIKKIGEKFISKLGPKYEEWGKRFGDMLGGDLEGVNVIDEFFRGLKWEFTENVIGWMSSKVLTRTGSVNPERLKKTMDTVKQKLIERYITKPGFDKYYFGKNIQKSYESIHYDNNDEILNIIAKKIQDRDFPDYSADDVAIKGARSVYMSFLEGTYKLKHDADFEISFVKDVVDNLLLMGKGATGEIGLDNLSSKYIKKFTKYFNQFEKGRKVLKSGMIDSVMIYHWSDFFGRNEESIKRNALWAFDEHIAYVKPDYSEEKLRFMNELYANENFEPVERLYENKVSLDDPARDIVDNYYDLVADKNFYGMLINSSEAIYEEFPENNDIKEFYSRVSSEYEKISVEHNQVYDQVMALDVLKKKSDVNFQDIMIGLVIIVVIRFVLLFLLRKHKKIKTVLMIIGIIFISLYIVGTYDILKKGISGYLDTNGKTNKSNNLISNEFTNTIETTNSKDSSDSDSNNNMSDNYEKTPAEDGAVNKLINDDYGFVIEVGDIVHRMNVLIYDDLGWAKHVYVYCYELDDKEYDSGMDCPKGEVGLFEIDVYTQEQYEKDVKDSPYDYTLLGESSGNYFVFSHPNGMLPEETTLILSNGLYEKVVNSFEAK